jgi:glyoxylase-like metal-dependent hydrolase (beta-lactamase superfamily II)
VDFEVTNVLRDGETVEAGSVALRVFAVPGHTSGSSEFLAGVVLFMGDCANADKQGRLRGAHFLFSENMGRNRESLKALARRLKPLEKKVKVLAPAHTGSLSGLKPLLELVGER